MEAQTDLLSPPTYSRALPGTVKKGRRWWWLEATLEDSHATYDLGVKRRRGLWINAPAVGEAGETTPDLVKAHLRHLTEGGMQAIGSY